MNVITSTTIAPTATQQLSAPVKPFIQMSSGMAGGISNAQRAPEPPNIPSLPLVSSAVAAMAAYAAYELERKREEELARQAAEEEHKAEMRAEAYARAEAGWDRASAKKKAEQVHTSNVYAQLRAQAAEKEHAAQVYTQLRAQAAEKERQKANEDFRRGERAPETVTVPQNKSWLQKAWDNTRNFGQKAATAVTTVTQSIMASIPKPGGPKVLAEPMPTKYQTGNKDDGCGLNIFCWLKKWFGGGSTPPVPTPDISAIQTQAMQTAVAPYTQTAQARPTAVPTATPLPLSLKVAGLADQRYQSNNPNYYQFGYDGSFPGSSNCSNFVSQVLWESGIRFPASTWNGDAYKSSPLQAGLGAWYRTPEQQQLFSSYNGEFRIVLKGSISLKDDPAYTSILKNYPQLFSPGNLVFSRDNISFKQNGDLVPARSGEGQFSHVVIVDINSTPGNPLVIEQDGPADYVVENGAYKAIWDSTAQNGNGDYFYVRNQMPNRQPRALSDVPTNPIIVTGNPAGDTIVTVSPAQLSIVPVEKIDLSTYGISPDVLRTNPRQFLNPDLQTSKPCFQIQESLYYCPPTSTISGTPMP